METIDITMPKSWLELTAKIYKDVCKAFAAPHLSVLDIKIALMLRWEKMKVVKSEENNHIISIKTGGTVQLIKLSDDEIYNLSTIMNWLEDLPPVSLRPDMICGRRARDKGLESLTFEQFIILDNTLQGYIATLDNKLLLQIGRILYPDNTLFGIFRRFRPKPWQMTAILFWISGAKKLFAKRYPTFFQPTAGKQKRLDADIIRRNVETMLRALTKGDITKDRQIRDAPLYAALAELEAIAIESEKLKAKSKK